MRILWKAIKQALIGSIVIGLVFLMFGCQPFLLSKDPKSIRIAMDECTDNKLDTVLFKLTDNTVYAIRCTPFTDDIQQTVIVRPKTRINLLRPFTETQYDDE